MWIETMDEGIVNSDALKHLWKANTLDGEAALYGEWKEKPFQEYDPNPVGLMIYKGSREITDQYYEMILNELGAIRPPKKQ